jgi:hypothetical protein
MMIKEVVVLCVNELDKEGRWSAYYLRFYGPKSFVHAYEAADGGIGNPRKIF